jgi:hypothetical protein
MVALVALEGRLMRNSDRRHAVRLHAFALCALIAAAGSPALAGTSHEPPDPCRNIHGALARGHCQARHPAHTAFGDGSVHFGDGSVHFRGSTQHGSANEGWEQDRGRK